jgi:hypothetical protein
MRLTREQLSRPVKLDVVTLDQIRQRDLIRDPISGIRVAARDGELTLQDLRERVGDPHAVGICLAAGGAESGAGASGPEVRQCAVALLVVAEHGGDARVDLDAGGAFAIRQVGARLQLCLVGPDGAETSIEIGDKEARKVVGALLTILEFFAAQEEAERRGRIPTR